MQANVCMSVHFLKLKSVFMVLGAVIKKWMDDEELQVDNCCVVYDYKNKRIVLFYQSDTELNMAEFRKELLTKIPRYMFPSECHCETMLRQNSSGKIDRAYYNSLFR